MKPRQGIRAALEALASLSPEAQLDAAELRLRGGEGPLGRFTVACELVPRPETIDGQLLELLCSRALNGSRGAIFTAAPESRILAAFGLATAAVVRGGPPLPEGVAMLLGVEPADTRLRHALMDLRVLDPACGGGALLVAAERLARQCGARLSLQGIDLAPLASRACAARLELLGCRYQLRTGDAFELEWPEIDLLLANPPFLRHESLSRNEKFTAMRASGLPARADLSAHFAALALRRAPVAALVWPRALFTSRSAAPLLAEARARGGFELLLRSRTGGSFTASVDTCLAVWRAGSSGRPAAEASVPLSELTELELAALARSSGGGRIRLKRGEANPISLAGARRKSGSSGVTRVGAVCEVRFGLKSGCNGFFHLKGPLGVARRTVRCYSSALMGEVKLASDDVVPLLATLKEARAPEWAEPGGWLFRPSRNTATAKAYVERGEALGIHHRPTCAARSPWWRMAPDRLPAPVLYPAKVGTRAFAFLNQANLFEDKKWHALFPRTDDGESIPPWLLALVLSSSPVRLEVDRSARQLTGSQAIADVDCNVLAAAPFPRLTELLPLLGELSACRSALARSEVSTDLSAMLARPAQRELDLLSGRAMGMTPRAVQRCRRELVSHVTARLEHAAQIRARAEREEL